MSLPAVIALALGLSLTAYAVLAGGDFGAGALDLLAGKRSSDHEAIAATIGPLWEAHHVWLIFSITILFSAFPAGFAALGTVLLAPLTLALIAIVVRGVASVAAPLLVGASAAAVGQVSRSGHRSGTPLSVPWTGLFAALSGLLAV